METLNYLIEKLIKENDELSNIVIPKSLNEKKDLYRALRNIREPKPIDNNYLKIQDKYLQEEIKNKGIIQENEIPKYQGIISVYIGDITTIKCDAIVNACNEYLLGCFNPSHRCIDNTIHSFAGMQLREKCNKIMQGKTLPNGEVILTEGYNLPCKYIIHTVGPQIEDYPTKQDREDLKNCYLNSLKLAKKNNLKTITFPCISTGLYSFPNEEACKIAIKTVSDYLKANPNTFDHIIFNVFKSEDYVLYRKYIKGSETA